MKTEQETWQQLGEDVGGVYVVLLSSVGVLCELVMLGSESVKENVKILFNLDLGVPNGHFAPIFIV